MSGRRLLVNKSIAEAMDALLLGAKIDFDNREYLYENYSKVSVYERDINVYDVVFEYANNNAISLYCIYDYKDGEFIHNIDILYMNGAHLTNTSSEIVYSFAKAYLEHVFSYKN